MFFSFQVGFLASIFVVRRVGYAFTDVLMLGRGVGVGCGFSRVVSHHKARSMG